MNSQADPVSRAVNKSLGVAINNFIMESMPLQHAHRRRVHPGRRDTRFHDS